MASTIQKKKNRKKNLMYLLFLLPGLLYLLINNYIPMFGTIIAFKHINYQKGILGSDWVGLKNFKFLFATNDAWVITRNTLLYNLAFIVINTVVGIIFICDVVSKKLKKLYQSAVLLPYLMSIVIISYIVFAFLSTENGMVNNSLLIPFGKNPISWYAEPKYWPFILTLVNVWKGVGYGCLIYISAINGIPKDYYEAANLDGAGKWKQIRCITLPSLVPSVITLTLLSIGRIFNYYDGFACCWQSVLFGFRIVLSGTVGLRNIVFYDKCN